MSMVHPRDLPALEKSLEEALFFREGRNIELRICHANGSWQEFESTVSYIFHDNGTAKNALIVSRDTSERKLAEKEIRKLAAFPRFNPNPVMEFSAEGHLTYFNDAAMNLARSLKRPHPQMILPLKTSNMHATHTSTRRRAVERDLVAVPNGRVIPLLKVAPAQGGLPSHRETGKGPRCRHGWSLHT